MDIELWWLPAFAAFFGLGWLAARIDIKHLVKESRALPRSYFTGLNFLLNEQPDKAIDAFVEAVNLDPQTIELHFALGNLFRRRGETDRAIRVHQRLIERDDLSTEQRLQALSALGQDYLKAGLLDRAEEVFIKLRDTALHEEACRYLIEVYSQEKEWQKAIDIARSLPDDAQQLGRIQVANYFCELAALDIAHSRFDDARTHLEQALEANKKSVRAQILLGDLENTLGRLEAAVEAWKRVEQQNPIYVALVAQRIMDACRKLDQIPAGLQLLRSYLEHYPSLDLLDTVFQSEMEREGPAEAYRVVRAELARNPTLLGLDKLLEAQI
ncbi:MAG: lipopolysaccharide assembly protein LapB, partial [Pseudomonadota bacterium]